MATENGASNPATNNARKYCVCLPEQPKNEHMLACDSNISPKCTELYHLECVGIADAASAENAEFICPHCKSYEPKEIMDNIPQSEKKEYRKQCKWLIAEYKDCDADAMMAELNAMLPPSMRINVSSQASSSSNFNVPLKANLSDEEIDELFRKSLKTEENDDIIKSVLKNLKELKNCVLCLMTNIESMASHLEEDHKAFFRRGCVFCDKPLRVSCVEYQAHLDADHKDIML